MQTPQSEAPMIPLMQLMMSAASQQLFQASKKIECFSYFVHFPLFHTFNFSCTGSNLSQGASNLLELVVPWLSRGNGQDNGKTGEDNKKLGHDDELLRLDLN